VFKFKELRSKISSQISDFQARKTIDSLNYDLALIVWQALKTTRYNKRDIERALLYFLLNSKSREALFIFQRAYLNLLDFKKKIKETLFKKDGEKSKSDKSILEKILIEISIIARERKKETISLGDLLIRFSEEDDFFQEFLVENDLTKKDIINISDWFERWEREAEEKKGFWKYKNLLKKGFLGRDWASGFTLTLDQYSLDLRQEIKKKGFRKVIGHKEESEETERILQRSVLNNVLLIGDSGSGRKSVIEKVAQKSFLGLSYPTLNYKRFLILDIGRIVSQFTSGEEIEAVLDKCFQEAVTAGNIILIIDEFQNCLQATTALGRIDISSIIARYLHLAEFQIVAITNFDGLHKIVEREPTILNLFDKVKISPIPHQEALEVLEDEVPYFEEKYKKFITYSALREVIKLTDRYIKDAPFPEKAVNLLDEIMVYVSRIKKTNVVLPKDVNYIVSEKTEIPIGEAEEREKSILLNLESLIHKRIINQEKAVKDVSSALRRARSGVHEREKPIGNFLFLGPTGVGKTETAKALTEIYFGREEKMIRIDMAEYQSPADIPRLIGSADENGILSTAVRENPFSSILLDEIEKAHPKILNLFLQMLDEGELIDGLGKTISFKETIIIATSNAGAEIIRRDISEDKKLDIVKEDLLDHLFRENTFRPEFINRFDSVVVFKPLTKDNLLDISQLMLAKVKKSLKNKGINFEVTQALKEKIVELGYSPAFGAREMRRTIQDKVENNLAEAILSGRIKRNNTIKVDPNNFRVIITK
jgi:ATP-dependent Clp protease ATP-binding subunit ClpC